MDKQLLIELKQKLNAQESNLSNHHTKVADKKRNVLIAYTLIVLGIVATVASGGIGVLLFILIIPYVIWTLRSKKKSQQDLISAQEQLVSLKNEIVQVENS